ncbi:MAG TPA: hypothetical protein VHE30_00450 [Polyangiaceae bacterium]|nr:hypothetical protein [Polyangiaceae bacterium]
MAAFSTHGKPRARLAAGVLALGLSAALAGRKPPEHTVPGLAGALSEAAGGDVAPGELAWEESRGPLFDPIFGRRVLFLAHTGRNGERDLFRARVRVTPEGQAVRVVGVTNLTSTPLGDDAGLDVQGDVATYATTAFGRVQGVTALSLSGAPSALRPRSVVGRLLSGLWSLERTDSFSGIGRTDLVFSTPARAARLSLHHTSLDVEVEDPDLHVVLDVPRGTLAGGVPRGVEVVQSDDRGRSALPWAVDVVRGVVGTVPVAWLERLVFGVRDAGKRAVSALSSWSGDARPKKGEEPVAHVLTPREFSAEDSGFPPAPIPSLWESPRPGEGQWIPVEKPYLPKLPAVGAARPTPYFYTTYIRPDPERPYTEVLLVAMDMRQLELGMEGGYEEPEPLVGPPGTGKLPRDPKILPRVVAAFNGAFKAEHGGYGMMVERRVLLPAVARAATITVTDAGAGFGTWPDVATPPPEVISLRQNLDPLVDGDVVNPTRRSIWGYQVAGESTLTERTALCITRSRHVYFAWGRDITGHGLARALKQAGCDYAVHLDMNPRHCGFVFMHAEGPDPKDGHFELADSKMSVLPSRYLVGSDKDFFYVTLREPTFSDPSGAVWAPSAGAMPPPLFLPGIFEREASLGDLSVKLFAFDAGRVDWVVRAGAEEPSVAGARSRKVGLEPELGERALAAIGLGHTTDTLRYGIGWGGEASLELRSSYATLVVAPGRTPRIEPPGKRPPLAGDEEAVQLPLLAEEGAVDQRASDRGATRVRGALCVTPSGRVLVAVGRHDSSDPIASALVVAGCRRVVALDRGSRHGAFVARAGTADAPRNRYDVSALYALARPMTPRAFRFPAE